MRIAGIILSSVLAVGGLSACKTKAASCKQDNKGYVGAKEMPPLKPPAGLEAPDTRNALKVPVLNSPERIRGKDEPCLDVPPPFTTPKGPDAKAPN